MAIDKRFKLKRDLENHLISTFGNDICKSKYTEESYGGEAPSKLTLYYTKAEHKHIGTWNTTTRSGWSFRK